MSKLGKLVLVLVVVTVIAFSIAGLALVRSEQLTEYLERNEGIRFEGGFIEWLRSLDEKSWSVGSSNTFSVSQSRELTNLNGRQQLVVSTVIADIQVEMVENIHTPRVELEGTVSYHGDEQPHLAVLFADSAVKIDVEYERNNSLQIQSGTLKLTVLVPADSFDEFRLNSVSGNVSVDGLDCEELEMTTISGRIRVTGGAMERLDADSVSGDVAVDMDLLADETGIRTVSGGISVEAHTLQELDLDFSAISGRAEIDYPFDTVLEEKNNALRMIAGDGRVDLKVRSTSGDMKLTLLN